jgi:hypothetical protein
LKWPLQLNIDTAQIEPGKPDSWNGPYGEPEATVDSACPIDSATKLLRRTACPPLVPPPTLRIRPSLPLS